MRFTKSYQLVAAVTLCAASVVSQAKDPIQDAMREMLVNDALLSGEHYHMAKLCGAPPDALEAYKARKEREANVEKAAYKQLKVSYLDTFHSAESAATEAYAALGADANSSDRCKAEIKQLTCTGLRC